METEEVPVGSEEVETEKVQQEVENHIPEDYAAAVVITINPQIKLYLNENRMVIGTEYLNEDAKDAFSEVALEGNTLEDSMKLLVDAAVESEYLADGKDVKIEIAEIREESLNSEEICNLMESAAAAAVEEHQIEATVSVQKATEQENVISQIAWEHMYMHVRHVRAEQRRLPVQAAMEVENVRSAVVQEYSKGNEMIR